MTVIKLLLQMLIPGLCLGCVYGLNGIGSALLYKGSRTINNAQGPVVGMGALIGYTLQSTFGLGLIPSTVIVVVITFWVGALLQILVISRVEKRAVANVVIATLALGLIIKSGNLLVYGSRIYGSANIVINGSPFLHIASLNMDILWSNLVAIGVSFLAMVGIHFFLNRSHFGMAMRAAAMDPIAAESCGISVVKTRAVTWGIMSALGALSGCLMGPLFGISCNIGIALGQKGNTGAVLGGYGNMFGAVIGGLIVGVAETIFGYICSPYQNAFTYILFLVFILFLPRGITNEKALEEG